MKVHYFEHSTILEIQKALEFFQTAAEYYRNESAYWKARFDDATAPVRK